MHNDSFGKEFNNIENLKKYILQNSLSLLGSSKDYKFWTSEINLLIKKICKKNKINNIEINKLIKKKYVNHNLKKQNLSVDGVHIINEIILYEILNKIINKD